MNRKFLTPRLAAAVLMVLPAGCVGIDKNPMAGEGPPPPGAPCQVVSFWDTKVHLTPDPTRNGTATPALAGRVYLEGPDIGIPMTGDGGLAVVAYDGTAAVGPTTVPLQAWQFDPVTLHRLLKKDVVGWGYTLPLVWPDLPRNLTRVQLRVCYQPVKGSPIYSDSPPMPIEFPDAAAGGPVVTESGKPRS